MPTELPPLLKRFVTHMNDHDAPAFTACFAEDAVVEDEGQTHRGRDAITAWISNAFAHYAPRLEVSEVLSTESETILRGVVSGTFPGSPIVLNYHLVHDGQSIASLRCTV